MEAKNLPHGRTLTTTLLLLFCSGMTRGIEWPDLVRMRTWNAETVYYIANLVYIAQTRHQYSRTSSPSRTVLGTFIRRHDTSNQIIRFRNSFKRQSLNVRSLRTIVGSRRHTLTVFAKN